MPYNGDNFQSFHQLSLQLSKPGLSEKPSRKGIKESIDQNWQSPASFQLSQKLSREKIKALAEEVGIPTKKINQCKIGEFVKYGPCIILHVKKGHWEAIKLIGA
ncbi:hypothetical protein [Geitlerinema sp. PCC 9228]|jgi:hypothetical protein|uniref:hypothetical protein n=1 Tax=Geitlerinema sp. PCC 9228 TaxID=111611 RepID=UPI0008F9DA52|nr:hypothetical protein [Geitlerinema sp. PCC 9228]